MAPKSTTATAADMGLSPDEATALVGPATPPADTPPADVPSTTPDLCGKPVAKKDKEGNVQLWTADEIAKLPEAERADKEIGKPITAPCIKARGHAVKMANGVETGHSWRAYTKVDRGVISLADVQTFSAVPTDEVVESVREQEDSDVQKAINDQVIAAYHQWVKVGKPKTWGEAIKKGAVAKYGVTPENEKAWRSMLRIAASRTQDRSDIPHISVKQHPKIKKMVDGTFQLWWYAVEHKARETDKPAESPNSAQATS